MADSVENISGNSREVVFHKMTPEEESAEIARLREKAIKDEVSAINFAKAEEREKIAARMRAKGYTEEQIRAIFE